MKININSSNEFYLHNGFVKPCNNITFQVPETSKVFYEVIRVINGKPLFLHEHIERLTLSTKMTEIQEPDTSSLEKNIMDLIAKNGIVDKNLKISYWISNKGIIEFLAYFVESNYPTDFDYKHGVNVELLPMSRHNPNIKLENPSLRHSADKVICISQTREALLVNDKGYITEGSRSNFFAIFENTLITSPAELVLKGITREMVIKLALDNHITFCERPVHTSEIVNMEGAFITGTSSKVLPIIRIGDHVFPSIPELTTRLMVLYDNMVEKNTR